MAVSRQQHRMNTIERLRNEVAVALNQNPVDWRIVNAKLNKRRQLIEKEEKVLLRVNKNS